MGGARIPTSPAQSPTAPTSEVLSELVAHLRHNRDRLRELWVERIVEGKYLTAMSAEEIFAEATSVYDSYLEVLETGSDQRRTHGICDEHRRELMVAFLQTRVATAAAVTTK